jgi:hypothetical protein
MFLLWMIRESLIARWIVDEIKMDHGWIMDEW